LSDNVAARTIPVTPATYDGRLLHVAEGRGQLANAPSTKARPFPQTIHPASGESGEEQPLQAGTRNTHCGAIELVADRRH